MTLAFSFAFASLHAEYLLYRHSWLKLSGDYIVIFNDLYMKRLPQLFINTYAIISRYETYLHDAAHESDWFPFAGYFTLPRANLY